MTTRAQQRLATMLALVAAGANLRPAITGLSPLMPELRRSYQLPANATVFIVAVPVLLLGLGSPLGPALARRLANPVRAVAVGLLAIATGIGLRCLWAPLIFPGTVVAALGITVVAVLLPSIVRGHDLSPGAATAAYGTAMSVGAAAAPAVSGMLVDAGVPVGLSNAVWAFTALVAALVWLRNPPRAPEGTPRTAGAGRLPRADAAAMAALFALQAMLFFSIVIWLPEYIRAQGSDAAAAGLGVALFSAVGVGGAVCMPIVAARLERRTALLGVVSLGSACGFLVLAAGGRPVLAALVLGLSQASIFPLAISLFVLRARDAETAARLSSVSQGRGFTVAALGLVALAGVRTITDWSGFWLVLSALAAAQLLIGVRAAANHPLALARADPRMPSHASTDDPRPTLTPLRSPSIPGENP